MVKQQALYDCYLACMCMVLGITYEEITQRLGSEFVARIHTQGCYGDDVDKMYASLGLINGRDFKRVYRFEIRETTKSYGSSAEFARSILWGRRALIQVKSVNDEGMHHVVYWDGFEFFDPSNRQLHQWDTLEPMNITIFNERPNVGPIKAPLIIEEEPDSI
jgi:hypothetical protein